jgi:hypothetical protein
MSCYRIAEVMGHVDERNKGRRVVPSMLFGRALRNAVHLYAAAGFSEQRRKKLPSARHIQEAAR